LVSAAVLALTLGPAYLILQLFRRATRNRKSPLNIELLRSPGQSLREEIVDISIDIIGSLLMIPMVGLIMYSVIVTEQISSPERSHLLLVYLGLIGGGGVCLCLGIKTYRMLKQRNDLRLGYECELAVGQDLYELIRYGFRVFHDFPADSFNIDHIAIGPTGVFAIETKGRSKQVNAEKENWKLSFDGETLRFPSWSESKPIEQARRQAVWLSKWIEAATGTPQQVVPVLAFPGWFISRTKPSDLRIYNGKGSYHLAKGQRILPDDRIQAISYQLDNKCRDVKPGSYKKDS